jgi:hypothetical protein
MSHIRLTKSNLQMAAVALTSLPQANDMKQLLMHSLAVVQQSPNKETLALEYAHRCHALTHADVC